MKWHNIKIKRIKNINKKSFRSSLLFRTLHRNF